MGDNFVEKVPTILTLHGSNIGDVKFSSHVVGTTFVKNSGSLLRFLKDKVKLSDVLLCFIREPENQYDVNAVRVEVSVKGSGKYGKIGYVPKDIAPVISYVLNHKEKYVFQLESINFYGGDAEKKNIGIFFDYRIIDIKPDNQKVDFDFSSYNSKVDLDKFFGDGDLETEESERGEGE